MIKVENIYTSGAANKIPGSLDWGDNGLICYGAGNAIAILDPAVILHKNSLQKLIKIFFSLIKHHVKS